MAKITSDDDGDRIVIEMYPGQPVELGDLSGSFSALARVYERHYRKGGEHAPKLHVTKLETGSVLLEIAPYTVLLGAISMMDGGLIVAEFTNRIRKAIQAFSAPSDTKVRVDPPPIEDAKDIKEFTKPLLGKSGACLKIKHAKYEKEDGERRTVVEYTFDEHELNRAAINIDKELEDTPLKESDENREIIKNEVMLFMDQTKRGPGKQKGRTGDRGVIPEISKKVLPVYFRKSFQNLKDQITKDVNPMTSTFVVDVHVQCVNGEPKGYIVTEIHEAIPGDDDI